MKLEAGARNIVLIQFAGLRRNEPTKSVRPGLRLATARLPETRRKADMVEVIVAPRPPLSRANVSGTAERMLSLAEVLVADIKRKRRDERCSLIDLSTASDDGEEDAPIDPYDIARLVDRFHLRLGDRLRQRARHGTRLIVSTETGSPAYWVALLEVCFDLELDVATAVLEGNRVEIVEVRPSSASLVGAPSRPSPKAQLDHLSRLPPGRTVLFTGPTGSGKTRLAHDLHRRWAERGEVDERAFRDVNCASFSAQLLESELFGHVRGAFTGADRKKDGLMKVCDGGTLLLDEIGEMPPALQAKLLHALDTQRSRSDGRWIRSFRPVGSTRNERSQVRLLFATNKDLLVEVQRGRFRDDLLARIQSFDIELPPLSEARHRILYAFLERLFVLRGDYGKARFVFERGALHRLRDFALSPRSVWLHNYRDVLQSCERLAFSAWAGQGYKAHSRDEVYISLSMVNAEIDKLRGKWLPLAGRSSDEAWLELERAIEPGLYDRLSWIERWEARYLLEARRDASSDAEAWKLVIARRQLPDRGASNPSDAFRKRWKRFVWR